MCISRKAFGKMRKWVAHTSSAWDVWTRGTSLVLWLRFKGRVILNPFLGPEAAACEFKAWSSWMASRRALHCGSGCWALLVTSCDEKRSTYLESRGFSPHGLSNDDFRIIVLEDSQ